MEVRAIAGNLAEQQVETLVVEVAEGASRLSGPAAQVDAALGGAITAMIRGFRMKSRNGTRKSNGPGRTLSSTLLATRSAVGRGRQTAW